MCSCPVNPSHRNIAIGARSIDDKVGNLSVEDKSRGIVTQDASILILVSINDPTASEVGAGLDDRETIRVANDLGVVIIYDRPGDDVFTGWEVDCGGSGSGSSTFAWRTTIAAAYGKILEICVSNLTRPRTLLIKSTYDSSSIIGLAVTLGAELLNIAKDLVTRTRVKCCFSRLAHALHPIRASSRRGIS